MSEDYNYVRGVPDLDDEIKRLRARQAVLVEALTRIGDPEFRYSSDDDEDTQLSLRMADARAALAQEKQGEGA